jgi:hypothetical protein
MSRRPSHRTDESALSPTLGFEMSFALHSAAVARAGRDAWQREFSGALVVAACAVALGACARQRPAAPASAVARAAPGDERQRLGAVDDASGEPAEEQGRWRRIAEVEERAGNATLAAEAARLYLDSAATTAALATSPDASADKRLEEAATFVVGMAARHGAATGLLVRVVEVAPDVARAHRAELRAAIRAGIWFDDDARDRLLALFAGDVEMRARLRRQGWHRTTGDVSADELARLGPEAAELLVSRFDRVLEGGDRGELRKIAGLLLERDGLNLRARVTAHLLDDTRWFDDELLRQVLGSSWNRRHDRVENRRCQDRALQVVDRQRRRRLHGSERRQTRYDFADR